MRPETLERALHLWPKWQESIEGARVQLEFQPDYDEEEWTKWDRKHGWHEVLGVCLHELEQTLNLPWYFAPYWMSCFFSNYKRVDGTYDFLEERQFYRLTAKGEAEEEVWQDPVRAAHPEFG